MGTTHVHGVDRTAVPTAFIRVRNPATEYSVQRAGHGHGAIVARFCCIGSIKLYLKFYLHGTACPMAESCVLCSRMLVSSREHGGRACFSIGALSLLCSAGGERLPAWDGY